MRSPLSSVDQPSSAVRSIELPIGGMTCAACAARVERKLNKLGGVHASVNSATEKSTVKASAQVGVGQLIAQVEHAGYHAAPIEPDQPAAHEEPADDPLPRLGADLPTG